MTALNKDILSYLQHPNPYYSEDMSITVNVDSHYWTTMVDWHIGVERTLQSQ